MTNRIFGLWAMLFLAQSAFSACSDSGNGDDTADTATDTDTNSDSDVDTFTDSTDPTDPSDSDSAADTQTDTGPVYPDLPVTGLRVIYETDMTLDVDDVGALAVLHGLQNEGKATIMAVCYNEVHVNFPAGVDAINTWYGRGNIPIGIYDKELVGPDWNAYLGAMAALENDPDDNVVDSALSVYKRVLAAQPDDSVVVISVGFLNNLYDLLMDPEGFALVERKVTLLAVMGGLHNDDFNFVRHTLVDETAYVIENWPGTLVVTDTGSNMITGETLSSTTPADNPVRVAFETWTGGANQGRSSWDEVTALYAVLGTEYYSETWDGGGSLTSGYEWTFSPGIRGYAEPDNDWEVEQEIERLMTLPPI